jgi:hypothetical protein
VILGSDVKQEVHSVFVVVHVLQGEVHSNEGCNPELTPSIWKVLADVVKDLTENEVVLGIVGLVNEAMEIETDVPFEISVVTGIITVIGDSKVHIPKLPVAVVHPPVNEKVKDGVLIIVITPPAGILFAKVNEKV